MREIIFRGKNIYDGKWAYGFYVTEYGEHYIFYDYGDNKRTAWIPIDPATVGQYIGLTDKNGTKIFEGDVLQYLYELHFDKGFVPFRTLVTAEKMGSHEDVYGFNIAMEYGGIEWSEVIGNIHDNPELLEVKK